MKGMQATTHDYDLVVIGSGPAGEKAATKAAYYGKRVALVEQQNVYGGAGVNTGTLPSKTLKATALYLSGLVDSGLFGVERKLDHTVTASDFLFHKNRVCSGQSEAVGTRLKAHGVAVYQGRGSLLDANTVLVDGAKTARLRASHIIIATGSYPFHPPEIPFDGRIIHDSDTILEIERLPRSLIIVGAGVIGCEYATIFAVMGCEVWLVNSHGDILPFLDVEIRHHLVESMQTDGVKFVFGARLSSVARSADGVSVELSDGRELKADMMLYAAGRNGRTTGLNLEQVGIEVGAREQIPVNDQYQTKVPSIYAVGDVIGFPSLASTSMDQGRIAVAHIYGLHDQERLSPQFPYGIYTIPEVSTFGMTAEDAEKEGIEVGECRAYYVDSMRGQILGVTNGLLKLVYRRSDARIIGVHIFGRNATELIHYGMGVVAQERTLLDVANSVYNTPTLHELYKSAALDGLMQLHSSGMHG